MTRSSQQIIDRAAALADAGRVEAAEAVLKEALRRYPDSTAARRELAMLYQTLGWAYAEAFQWEQLLASAPGDAMARRELHRLAPIIDTIREAARANPPEMKFSIRRHMVMITLAGALSPCHESGGMDVHFEQQMIYIKRLLSAGLRHFIVDMTNVTFVSSYFLSALVVWAHTVFRGGGRICVCGLRPEIDKVFRLGRLGRTVPCYKDLMLAADAMERRGAAETPEGTALP